jgi:sporulation protein YlmC with PRC-barrel domain
MRDYVFPRPNMKETHMTDLKSRTMVKLGDSDLTVANKDEDIRGRTVLDSTGEKIGEVKDLMIDEGESKVRFMQVGAGGVMGIGDKHFLIPIDAITRIDQDNVQVDQTRSHIEGAPTYTPDLVLDDKAYTDIYGYYGYTPFWMGSYAYPAYPYFGRRP